jgi:hypothetical protein
LTFDEIRCVIPDSPTGKPFETLRAVSGSIGLTAVSLSKGPVERPRLLGRRAHSFDSPAEMDYIRDVSSSDFLNSIDIHDLQKNERSFKSIR